MKDLKIRPVLNGYLVEAGCTTVVFTSRKSLLTSLDRYLRDSKKEGSTWLRNAVNKPEEGPVEQVEPVVPIVDRWNVTA